MPRKAKLPAVPSVVVYDPNEGMHHHPCPDCKRTFTCDYGNCTDGKPLRCDDCDLEQRRLLNQRLFGGHHHV